MIQNFFMIKFLISLQPNLWGFIRIIKVVKNFKQLNFVTKYWCPFFSEKVLHFCFDNNFAKKKMWILKTYTLLKLLFFFKLLFKVFDWSQTFWPVENKLFGVVNSLGAQNCSYKCSYHAAELADYFLRKKTVGFCQSKFK